MAEASRLWDPRFAEEVLHLLKSLNAEWEQAELASLLDALRAGHPEAASDAPDVRRLARAALLQRLLALEASEIGLPDDLISELAELEGEFPGCRGTSPDSSEGGFGFRSIPKSPPGLHEDSSTDDLAALVAAPPHFTDPAHGALSERLEKLGATDPSRFLEILSRAASIWESGGDHQDPEPALAFPNYSAQAFEGWAKKKPAATFVDAALPVWDQLLGVSLTHDHSGSGASYLDVDDQLTWAINHPVGDLVHAVLCLLFRGPVQLDAGLAEDLTARLGRVLASPEPAAQAGRVLIASRLFPLHFADSSWAGTHLVPYLDWERGPLAQGCWQGYLWSPRLDTRLFLTIKVHFLEAFRHWGRLGRGADHLGDLLVSLAIDAEEGLLAANDARQSLRAMGRDGRAHVAWSLAKRLEQAEGQSADLWRDRIGPFISKSWPRDLQAREAGTSNHLLWMITKTGAAFGEAAALLLSSGIMTEVDERLLAISELKKHQDLVLAAPGTLLRLLDQVLPPPDQIASTQGWVVYGLGDVLKIIRAGAPEVTGTDEFRAIEERRGAGGWSGS